MWHPNTGAHALFRSIYDYWRNTGGRLGYPLETTRLDYPGHMYKQNVQYGTVYCDTSCQETPINKP